MDEYGECPWDQVSDDVRYRKKQKSDVDPESGSDSSLENAKSAQGQCPKVAGRSKIRRGGQASMFRWISKKVGTSGLREPALKRGEIEREDVEPWDVSNTGQNDGSTRACKKRKEIKAEFHEVIEISDSEDEKVPIVEPEKEKPTVQRHHRMTIQGICVEMPVKPYRCQEEVITAIINGCTTQQNCLLESPTGSGKTLALLCGSLAWQSDFHNKFYAARIAEKKYHQETTSKPSSETIEPKRCKEDEDYSMLLVDGDWDDDNEADYQSGNDAPERVPKIYYGSRTHRQLSQVIREFKKTSYKYKQMTILSSRDFSCIQDTTRNKNELCAELLDPAKSRKNGGCPYFNDNNKFDLGSYSGLAQNGIVGPWDIEELVSAGKQLAACPYFAARALMEEADIIFCPYNYLIDPEIRERLQLDLRGSVIIFDEAHNMEDVCREAGSVSVPDSSLEAIITDCSIVTELATGKRRLDEIDYVSIIERYCTNLRQLVNSTIIKDQKGAFNTANSDQWTGAEFLSILEINKITKRMTSTFLNAAQEAVRRFNKLKEDPASAEIENNSFSLSTETTRQLEKIMMGLNMLTSVHVVDYRVVVKQVYLGFKQEKSLELVCMNAHVIFGTISKAARSIILASGTLAPTSSFAGELGAKFPFLLQANHVTPPEQICIKFVTKASNGISLRGTYENVNNWGFQDEVGSILLTACKNVPHGILMFFSSYTVMTTLLKRWQSNDTMKKIRETKEIFQETRGNADLPTMMENYRQVIRNTSNGPDGKINGAVLFAVFRGKVAEGIDFSDNEARAVLTVGIPYAVRKDPSVDMKYRYNDANVKRGLLSGNEWYTIQAFRALNQALGRAIRHQNDWGAIILIDERFLLSRYANLLPTWMRSMVCQQSQPTSDLSKILRDFVVRQKKREKEADPPTL